MIRRNIFLLKIMHFFAGFWLFAPLAVIYFEQITNSYGVAMLVFSLVGIAQSLAEIPCGMISDRFNRKTNLMFYALLMCLGMVFWAWAGYIKSTSLLFLGSAIRGISFAFRSGTDTALIYETMQQLKKHKFFNVVLAKINAGYHAGALVAAFLATVLTYYFSLQTLVTLTIIPYFMNIIVIAFIVNPKSYFDKKMSPDVQLKKSIKTFIKNKKLRKYAILQILNDSISRSLFRFEATYFEQLIPLYLINVLRALQHCLAWVSFHLTALFSNVSLLKLLCYSTLGSGIIRIIALMMNNAVTPFLSTFQNIFYGTAFTSSTTLLQKNYSKGLRATLDSIVGFFNGFAVAIIGYGLGFFADVFSLRTAMFIGVIGSFAIALAYKRLFKPYKK